VIGYIVSKIKEDCLGRTPSQAIVTHLSRGLVIARLLESSTRLRRLLTMPVQA
jgi:hypothetical protein